MAVSSVLGGEPKSLGIEDTKEIDVESQDYWRAFVDNDIDYLARVVSEYNSAKKSGDKEDFLSSREQLGLSCVRLVRIADSEEQLNRIKSILDRKDDLTYIVSDKIINQIDEKATGKTKPELSPEEIVAQREEEKAKVLLRLEKDKNLSDEEILSLQKAASWVISRLSEEQMASLSEGDIADSDIKFRELAKIVLKNEIVTHYSGKSDDGKIYYADLDGKCSIGLFRLAGIEINTKDPAMFVPPGGSIDGKVMVDTSGKNGIFADYNVNDEVFDTTGGADHHDPLSSSHTSGTLLVHEVLTGLGMIDVEKYPYLKNMAEFVTKIDNASYTDQQETFLNSWKTMVGLAKYMSYEKLEAFFKEGKDPEKELTNEELIKYGLKVEKRDKGGAILVGEGKDRSLEHKQKIDSSLSEIENMEKEGLVVDTGDPKKFGKVVVDVGNHLKLGYETTRNRGYDTYIIWNPISESFFISCKNPFPDKFELSQGVRVRENMWIKAPFSSGELTLKLKEVLSSMAGDENITPTGSLKEMYEMEDKWESLAKTGERPEDKSRAEEYWKWVESKVPGMVNTQKEKLKGIIEAAAKDGIIKQRVKSVNEISENEGKRFSALRLLAKELGYKIGAFSINNEGAVQAKIVKKEEVPTEPTEPVVDDFDLAEEHRRGKVKRQKNIERKRYKKDNKDTEVELPEPTPKQSDDAGQRSGEATTEEISSEKFQDGKLRIENEIIKDFDASGKEITEKEIIILEPGVKRKWDNSDNEVILTIKNIREVSKADESYEIEFEEYDRAVTRTYNQWRRRYFDSKEVI